MTDLRGRRLPDTDLNELPEEFQAGDYWKCLVDGRPMNVVGIPSNLTGSVWRVVVPMSYGYAISGPMTKHTVREHEDGTISVLPNDGSSNSILVTGHHGEQWHGYVYAGVLRAV